MKMSKSFKNNMWRKWSPLFLFIFHMLNYTNSLQTFGNFSYNINKILIRADARMYFFKNMFLFVFNINNIRDGQNTRIWRIELIPIRKSSTKPEANWLNIRIIQNFGFWRTEYESIWTEVFRVPKCIWNRFMYLYINYF